MLPDDVYPVRWECKTSGKAGYASACAGEWRAGVCEKPRIRRSGGGAKPTDKIDIAVMQPVSRQGGVPAG